MINLTRTKQEKIIKYLDSNKLFRHDTFYATYMYKGEKYTLSHLFEWFKECNTEEDFNNVLEKVDKELYNNFLDKYNKFLKLYDEVMTTKTDYLTAIHKVNVLFRLYNEIKNNINDEKIRINMERLHIATYISEDGFYNL